MPVKIGNTLKAKGFYIMTKKLMTTKEAADYLRVAVQTVYNWRHQRKGPDYILVGGRSPRYRIEDLDKYLDANRVCLSA